MLTIYQSLLRIYLLDRREEENINIYYRRKVIFIRRKKIDSGLVKIFYRRRIINNIFSNSNNLL